MTDSKDVAFQPSEHSFELLLYTVEACGNNGKATLMKLSEYPSEGTKARQAVRHGHIVVVAAVEEGTELRLAQ